MSYGCCCSHRRCLLCGENRGLEVCGEAAEGEVLQEGWLQTWEAVSRKGWERQEENVTDNGGSCMADPFLELLCAVCVVHVWFLAGCGAVRGSATQPLQVGTNASSEGGVALCVSPNSQVWSFKMER